jgi:glycosyltransferase involved in cell wall biosynthesis
MKLLIQIPCFNEEKILPETIKGLPKSIAGIDQIEILVIDDGSTDRTAEVARELGVHHVLCLKKNRGLATAYSIGLGHCVKLGADIIVNTDADNQYLGADVEKIVRPILNQEAEFVVGARPLNKLDTYNSLKRFIHRWGTVLVSYASGLKVSDPVSGFRAFTREVALKTRIYSTLSYTLESLIQAGNLGFRVVSVDIQVNSKTRNSRLFKSMNSYLIQQLFITFRTFIIYRPLLTFLSLSGLAFFFGLMIGVRFLYFYFHGTGQGHIQSLIFASIMLISSVIFFSLGVIADLISVKRLILEELSYKLRKIEVGDDKTH